MYLIPDNCWGLQKQTNKKTWAESWEFLSAPAWHRCDAVQRGREDLSVGWHDYNFTLGEAVYISVFLNWGYFSLLNTGIYFLIILEENVFILKCCFLDLPILFPFSVSDLKEVLLPLRFPSLCILLSLICVVHPASSQFARWYMLMSEAFIEKLVWCIVLLLRQSHVTLKLENSLCPMKRGGKKKS